MNAPPNWHAMKIEKAFDDVLSGAQVKSLVRGIEQQWFEENRDRLTELGIL
jgi:hypothetical protein